MVSDNQLCPWRNESSTRQIERLFDAPVDFDLLKRLVVESVYEETIDPEIETVEERKDALCDEFGLYRSTESLTDSQRTRAA